jgi:DNA replication and repair protein RecF
MTESRHSQHSEEASTLTKDPSLDAQDDKKILCISSLSLNHFRNYTSERLEVSPLPVILTGHNGAGKTNILEALSLLTPGRGLRRAKLGDLDNRKEDHLPWAIAASINGMQGETKIGTGRDLEAGEEGIDKRIVKIDGKPARSQAELARHISIIWLTPQMEQLFNDGASAGRKFLDRLVYSFDPEHAARVNEYEFAMRERNKLLSHPRADAAWLDALELTMAETGAAIASARLHTVEHINHAIAASSLSFPKAIISISGIVEDLLKLGTAAVQVEEDFQAILRTGRLQDMAAARTLSGPHRSAMQVIHAEKQMPAEACSTGEQKALLLSIVLAEARSGARWHGVVPVLLLDEVVAHLDATRRLELFEEICQIGAQVWMTGTDEKLFKEMQEKAQFLMVENGALTRVK